jgi:tryptophan-rich sensory protein
MRTNTAIVASIGAVAAAALIGGSQGPQKLRAAAWYARLRKPSYTPPGAAIGLTWGVLETLLCVAGARLLTRPPSAARSVAVASWSATLLGLAGYPALFFGQRRLAASAAAAAGMFAATAATAASARSIDKVATGAMLPLTLWTGFAVVLSEELWRRN